MTSKRLVDAIYVTVGRMLLAFARLHLFTAHKKNMVKLEFRVKLVVSVGDEVTRQASTYPENRLRIRPAGVVSKNLIGDLKMAKAILSWSLREAYNWARSSA